MSAKKGHTQIIVYMPDDVLDQLNAICDYKGSNRSALINTIMGDYAFNELKKIDESKKFTTMLRNIAIKNGLTAARSKPKISLEPKRNEVQRQPRQKQVNEPPTLPDWRDQWD